MYVLSGFDALSTMVSNTTITITAYVVVKAYTGLSQAFTVNTYGKLGDHTKKIVLASFGAVALASDISPSTYLTYKQYLSPYFASTTPTKYWYEL